MDIEDSNVRKEVLDRMKEAADKIVLDYDETFVSRYLTPTEGEIYRSVQSNGFEGGAWYRPVHNLFVSASMVAITENEGLDRNILVPAAILHDIGYAFMDIPDVGGAAWEKTDIRIKHVVIGEWKAREILSDLGSEYTDDQIETIARIIRNHDDPYIGEPLETDTEKQHRDADRLFVMSAMSYYKDMIKYMEDPELEITPDGFLRQRVAFFYPSSADNPLQDRYQLDTDLVKKNEGERCEPFFTQTAKFLGDGIFVRRADELDSGIFGADSDEFSDQINKSAREEIEHIFRTIDSAIAKN